MNIYEVTIQLDIGGLDFEVEFEDGYEPTDDEILFAAIEVIKESADMAKLKEYRKTISAAQLGQNMKE